MGKSDFVVVKFYSRFEEGNCWAAFRVAIKHEQVVGQATNNNLWALP